MAKIIRLTNYSLIHLHHHKERFIYFYFMQEEEEEEKEEEEEEKEEGGRRKGEGRWKKKMKCNEVEVVATG